ncbi:hypothetical protein [Nitrosomonas sp. Nm33]|uniref:hypothetical protein n=1 Tax=Nitrosomonas sp. Nm33 TaxID=133724 RepID=UPI00089B0489|nr:hypothetical protein [Nitrosomonas sp. Nm33]SDZ07502.1 hypothetical protein SAMN05421755_11018 [Nitrosomonas sp. Nm33]
MTGQPNFKKRNNYWKYHSNISKDLDFTSLSQDKVNDIDVLITLAVQQPTYLYLSREKIMQIKTSLMKLVLLGSVDVLR